MIIRRSLANKNRPTSSIHALMEALIADEDAMDKEVADKVKDHKRKHDSDDDEDDDDDAFSWIKQGRSTKRRGESVFCRFWITDTREARVDSSMHRSDPESEHSEQFTDDISKQDEGNVSELFEELTRSYSKGLLDPYVV
ncbi:hypothetical protein Tco_1200947 [Tanacetum coccineum]